MWCPLLWVGIQAPLLQDRRPGACCSLSIWSHISLQRWGHAEASMNCALSPDRQVVPGVQGQVGGRQQRASSLSPLPLRLGEHGVSSSLPLLNAVLAWGGWWHGARMNTCVCERGCFESSLPFSAGSDVNKKLRVGGKVSGRKIVSLDFLLKIQDKNYINKQDRGHELILWVSARTTHRRITRGLAENCLLFAMRGSWQWSDEGRLPFTVLCTQGLSPRETTGSQLQVPSQPRLQRARLECTVNTKIGLGPSWCKVL